VTDWEESLKNHFASSGLETPTMSLSNTTHLVQKLSFHSSYETGARFTKYLTIILRLAYDNAKVTIDLRRTSSLQNILLRTQDFT